MSMHLQRLCLMISDNSRLMISDDCCLMHIRKCSYDILEFRPMSNYTCWAMNNIV